MLAVLPCVFSFLCAGQSFGLLNYGGEWKQQLHFVRRSFAPLLITAAGPLDSPTQTIHLISDIPRYLHGCEVEAMLWELGGATTPTQTWNATVAEVRTVRVRQITGMMLPGS